MPSRVVLMAFALASVQLLSTATADGSSLELRSSEGIRLDGIVSVTGRGGSIVIQSLSGAATMQVIDGVIFLYEWDEARAYAREHTDSHDASDARASQFDLAPGALQIAPNERPLLLIGVPVAGEVSVSGAIHETSVPSELLAGVAAVGQEISLFEPAPRVEWGWDAGWGFVGASKPFGVEVAGFPMPAGAVANLTGDLLLEIEGGRLAFTDHDGSAHVIELGVSDSAGIDAGEGGAAKRTRRIAIVEAQIASAAIPLGSSWGYAAPTLEWAFDGDVEWRHASGNGRVNGRVVSFRDATVEGRGRLSITPGQADILASDRSVAYRVAGEWSEFRANGVSVTAAHLPVAAVAAASIVVGLVALLYTRLSRADILGNKRRARIHEIVVERPGIHLRELARESGAGWGAFRGHFALLVGAGYLRTQRRGRYAHVFPVGATPDAPPASEVARKVLEAVPTDGSRVMLRELRGRVGVSRQLVNYHVRVLAENGAVVLEIGEDGARAVRRR